MYISTLGEYIPKLDGEGDSGGSERGFLLTEARRGRSPKAR